VSQFHFSDQAERDLNNIFDFIARDNLPAAEKLMETVEQKCQRLASHPGIGALRSDLAAALRAFPVGNYVNFYREASDGIANVRVIHGARDIPTLFTESE